MQLENCYRRISLFLESWMDTLELIGSTMGLGFLAGIRLYATVFALGLAIRLGWFHPGPGGTGLMILAHPAVLIASGLACVIEFFADKVPWVDSLWDSFHVVIRPIGAVLLASAALGNFDPAVRTILMILCGGVALASTGSKASTRLAVNHSPEPFSNIGLSLIEDAMIPAGMWISLKHPEIAMALTSIFLGVFLWLAPKVIRSVRLRWVALRAWKRGNKAGPISGDFQEGGMSSKGPGAASMAHQALHILAMQAGPIPEAYAQRAQRAMGLPAPPHGIRAAGTKTLDGMGNALGYLSIGENQMTFVAEGWIRKRTYSIPLASVTSVELRRGLLMHRLIVRSSDGDRALHIFRNVQIPETGGTAAENPAIREHAAFRSGM